MLLVNDQKAESLETDIALQQPMRTNDDVDRPDEIERGDQQPKGNSGKDEKA